MDNLAFAKFMSSPIGRGGRFLFGVTLMGLGLFGNFGQPNSTILVVSSLLPLASGTFNLCPAAPLLGVPFFGSKLPKD